MSETLGPFDHNQICTRDKCIQIGGVYQYKEDSDIFKVEVVADVSKPEWIGFTLKVLENMHGLEIETGSTFDCGAATGLYAYSGMWRLYDDGEYFKSPLKTA